MFGLFKRKQKQETIQKNDNVNETAQVHMYEHSHKESNGLITKDMTIGDIVQSNPRAAEVLTNHGIHCVGCHASPYETLEQGLMGHGMPQEEVDSIVSKINNELKSAKEEKAEVIITDEAAKKINELLKEKKAEALRVNVAPGGCSGFEYEFKLEDSKNNDDIVIEEKGIKLYINPGTMEMVKGSQIDYIDALQGAGFKVSNPNAKSTCGCGSSFS